MLLDTLNAKGRGSWSLSRGVSHSSSRRINILFIPFLWGHQLISLTCLVQQSLSTKVEVANSLSKTNLIFQKTWLSSSIKKFQFQFWWFKDPAPADIEHIPFFHPILRRLAYFHNFSHATGEYFGRFPKHQCFIPTTRGAVPAVGDPSLHLVCSTSSLWTNATGHRMSSVAGCFLNFTTGIDGNILWTEKNNPHAHMQQIRSDFIL